MLRQYIWKVSKLLIEPFLVDQKSKLKTLKENFACTIPICDKTHHFLDNGPFFH